MLLASGISGRRLLALERNRVLVNPETGELAAGKYPR